MREALLVSIRKAADEDGSVPPVVGLDEYFLGNDQEDSIAPNQVGDGRPDLKELYRRFKEIGQRSDVQLVLVGLHDDWVEAEKHHDVWPAGDTVHIYTSASRRMVESWIEGMAADGALKGWPRGKHKSAPSPKEGFEVFTVIWD
jgi:hypothetical protein